ncbi:MAG: exosortase/archaeosortase family protein [Desulfobacterales bacterium]|nr:exosortase/archaeosortase family protein [Desulfobacterales bacterium]
MAKTVIVFLLWAAAFMPVYPELWDAWMNNSNNSHGILVPAVSAFLAWTSRDRILNAGMKSSNWGWIILAASLFFYLLALAGHVAVVQRAMIVSSLCGLVIFNFGVSVFKVLAFPLLYLVFMIPVPDSIYGLAAFPLQLFATDVSHAVIQALGIPVLQEGNMLYFAQTQLEVAEACSGLRSMTAFVMLGVLFAYLMNKGWLRQIVLVASAIPLALFANIVRVTGTGILAHFYGEAVARGFLHDFSGIVVFAFGLALLSGEYVLLNRMGSKKHKSGTA